MMEQLQIMKLLGPDSKWVDTKYDGVQLRRGWPASPHHMIMYALQNGALLGEDLF